MLCLRLGHEDQLALVPLAESLRCMGLAGVGTGGCRSHLDGGLSRAVLAVATVAAVGAGFNGAVYSEALPHYEVRDLVARYPDWDQALVQRIIVCESRDDPLAYNPAGPYIGLGQIWEAHVPDPWNLFDPAYNVEVMHGIWLRQGYGAWPVCQWW